MKELINKLKRVNIGIIKLFYFLIEIFKSRLSANRKMKILFSPNENLEKFIKRGFLFTKYKIRFEKLCPDIIKNFDLVVPLTLEDVRYLDGLRNLIMNNPIPIPSMESIMLCDDKYALNQVLIAKGFGKYVPQMGGVLKYPYIVKKRVDQAGRHTFIISNVQEEKRLKDTINSSEYFSQELIQGTALYATHILIKDKSILCSLSKKHVFKSETPIQFKDNMIYSKLWRCPYLDLFSSILITIGFEGLCCFDYKVIDHRPFILEINPRFGGSLGTLFFSFIRHLK